jgi:uncharacterized OB-fold protein
MASKRILPQLDALNRDFWTAGARGELRITQCSQCSTFIHPPAPVCRQCHSDQVAPKRVAGTGTIDTFTINHQSWLPGMEVPFVIARVALDDAPGVYLTTNIAGCSPREVAIGDRVRVLFQQQEDVWLPLFEKVA